MNKYKSFDFNSVKGRKQCYIHMYLLINGVVEVDKLLYILETYHNLVVDKKELSSLIKDISDLELTGDFLHIKDMPFEVRREILKYKNVLGSYKILDDLDKVEDDYQSNYDKISSILSRFISSQDIVHSISFMILSYGVDKNAILSMFKEDGMIISNKDKIDMIRELKSLNDGLRLWIFNGFTTLELEKMSGK